jgi:hypothetical protein
MLRLTAMVGFEGGQTTTFNCGYIVGAAAMDFALYGTKGVLRMDDFVLDWSNSIMFKDPTVKLGYTLSTGTRGRSDVRFVEVATTLPRWSPSPTPR